jgi:hypothetical protein
MEQARVYQRLTGASSIAKIPDPAALLPRRATLKRVTHRSARPSDALASRPADPAALLTLAERSPKPTRRRQSGGLQSAWKVPQI